MHKSTKSCIFLYKYANSRKNFVLATILKIKEKMPKKAPFQGKNTVKMGKNRQFYEKSIKVPTKFLQFVQKWFFRVPTI